jgi:hypothetical protein
MPHLFLYASIALALIQIVDAFILVSNGGKCGMPQRIFAFVEYVWAGVSIWVLRHTTEEPLRVLASAFLIYVVAFYLVGLYLVANKKPSTVLVPKWVAIAGGAFGLVNLIGSALVASTLT